MTVSNHNQTANRVLLAQDGASSAGFAAALRQAGMIVLDPLEHIESLGIAAAGGCDVAVLHLDLPDALAMDMPNVLRNVCPHPYLPVMIISETTGQSRCNLFEGGADDVVSPRTPKRELVSRVRALIRIKQSHDRLSRRQTQLRRELRRQRQALVQAKRDNAYLTDLASSDSLTGLRNVRSFRQVLDHEFKSARRYNSPLSLLMIDVDHFKLVNDTYGHPAGDHVLTELAAVLKRCVRDSDVVARVGGEEFAVVLPHTATLQAQAFAQRMRDELAASRIAWTGSPIRITISIGLATYPADAEIAQPEMMMRFADAALLTAKQTGRDRIVRFADLPATTRRQLRDQPSAGEIKPQPAQV